MKWVKQRHGGLHANDVQRGMLSKTPLEHGYTIVETLIFLAVSAIIAVAAMGMVAGQQRRTEFSDAVKNLDSVIQDATNDTATGFSSINIDTSTQSCRIDASGVVNVFDIALMSAAERAMSRCIYLGRALQFTNTSDYRLLPVLGRQKDATGKEVIDLTTAEPVLFTAPPLTTGQIRGGALIGRVECASCATANIGTVAFLTTFQSYNAGSLTSGSSSTNLAPVITSTLTDSVASLAAKIHPSSGAHDANLSTANPLSGVKVCLESTGTRQYAVITLGGSRGKLSTAVKYYEGTNTCPTPLP